MLHRAGLALLLQLLQLARDNLPIPDLYKQKSTYWKNWLKLDDDLYASDDPEWVAFKAATGEINCKNVHDQVIAYAAITFKTVVLNNAWVPLVPRIIRLTKAVVKRHAADASSSSSGQTMTAFAIITQIRSSDPSYEDWPHWAVEFAKDIRSRLKLTDGTYLFDDYAKKKEKPNIAFPDLFMFNYWLQQRLIELKEKRIALSPLFRVRRAFVRLDKKVLIGMAKASIPNDKNVKTLAALERKYSDGATTKVPTKLEDESKQDYDARVAVILAENLKIKANGKNPDKGAYSLLTRLPTRLKDESKQDYDARVAPVNESNREIKSSEEYMERKAIYTKICKAKRAVASTLFRAPKRSGFRFDGSITTDGVAVCLQYSKPKLVQPDASQPQPKEKTQKQKQTRKQFKAKAKDHEAILYPSLPTYDPVSNTLVAGNDPGRTNIATVAYVLDKDPVPVRSSDPYSTKIKLSDDWTLSRSQYRVDSGIRSEDMDKDKRYADIHRFWNGGGIVQETADDIDQTEVVAALRTSDVGEFMAYIALYDQIRDKWWGLALRRRESRADFRRYSGKRKVLDSFFSNIKRTLEKRFPGVNIQIAYGHAYQTMKPTGKGEVAVPVHSTFKACQRVFGPGQVVPTDEYGSTAFEWDTGARKLAVYRTAVTGSRNNTTKKKRWALDVSKFGTTDRKNMPAVLDASDAAAVRDYERRRKNKIQVARSGLFRPQTRPTELEKTRYPEVRGLRFSTKTGTYLNRDLHAARTIGRLRTAEMMGLARPTPFCRR